MSAAAVTKPVQLELPLADDEGWIPLPSDSSRKSDSHPFDASWVLVKLADGSTHKAHWAEDLSGEEMPPFSGWFVDAGKYFSGIGWPVTWKELES